MSTAYDVNGRVDTVTYPTGFAVERVYNASGYLSQLRNAATPSEVFWTANTVDAEGHVLQETLGSGVVTNRQYNALSGRLELITAGSIQSLTLTHDAVGNLESRADGVMGWSESFTYDSLNRITGVTGVNGPPNKTYAYDAIGNITYKSDVGTYAYNDSAHVHAVTSAGGNTYTYDANGNMKSGAGRTLTWTSFDRPSVINSPGGSVTLTYDANHKRISKTTFGGETTVFVNEAFEEVTQLGVTKAKHYIRSGNGLIAIMEQVATVKTMKYVHNDQLGSINVITDATGAVLERLSFDAFGNPRNANGTDATPPPVSTQTTRGYTGHKMDAEVGLINMNARLYDPILGRFISADVTIDAPQDMQTYNRYTYVMNNPFAHTDPTGNWSWKNFWKAAKPVIAIAAAVATQNYLMTGHILGASFAAAGTTGMLAGNAVAASMISGGIAGAITGGAQGAVMGAFSAGLFFGAGEIGAYFQTAFNSQMAGIAAGVVANGLAGGAMSVMQGGDFGSGFLSGSIAKGLGSLGGRDFGISGDKFGQMVARVAIAGAIGGVASRAGGGDFWNGFQTGAFSRLFNTEMHREKGYFQRVWENFKATNTLTFAAMQQGIEFMTFETFASEAGGLTWKQSQRIIADSPHLKPNARIAFGMTTIGNSLLVTGVLEVGVGIGSIISEIPVTGSSHTVGSWWADRLIK